MQGKRVVQGRSETSPKLAIVTRSRFARSLAKIVVIAIFRDFVSVSVSWGVLVKRDESLSRVAICSLRSEIWACSSCRKCWPSGGDEWGGENDAGGGELDSTLLILKVDTLDTLDTFDTLDTLDTLERELLLRQRRLMGEGGLRSR